MPTVLVDAYNIIGFWPKLKKRMDGNRLGEARDMLLDEVTELAHMKGWAIKLIYGAYNREGAGSTARQFEL
ncbi:unnamed protein product, partial [Phaeothamnion confervicola]